MRYIYSHRFEEGNYAADPAASKERFDTIRKLMISEGFTEARPASLEEILEAHDAAHVDRVRKNPYLHEMASLAAGGAIQAAEIANSGVPTFAAIRPPGHHASKSSAWGFCYYNNMAIALLTLMKSGSINSAFILDFDLHTGDGNINILSSVDGIDIFNPDAATAKEYMEAIKHRFENTPEKDILAISAGFDQYIDDWGGLLRTRDFKTIGRLCREFSDAECQGRRFAILEGGYNYDDISINIRSFCAGFE